MGIRDLINSTINNPTVKDKVSKIALISLGLGTLSAGIQGINYVKRKLQQDPKRMRILEELTREDPVLKDADPEKLLEYYSVIYHAAPSITLNKGALREPLRNFIRFDKVDLATLKTLTEIEEKFTKINPSTNIVSNLVDAGKIVNTALSLDKTSSDPEVDKPLLKEATAAIYKHAKNKERMYRGVASLNYFKSKGVL